MIFWVSFFVNFNCTQGWGQFHFFNSIPIPIQVFSIPIPIPIPLLTISFNSNSNSNSGDFNSNSNSGDFKSRQSQFQKWSVDVFLEIDYNYSVNPIYRGRVYRGIGYIAVACWTPFFGAQERDIFREIAVTPWIQFAGDNFSRNLLTAIAFVLGPRETIFRETNSSLPVNAGWNTCCAVVNHAIDTSIVSQSRVQLIQCQCKSRLQIANLGINNAFLIKSTLFTSAILSRHRDSSAANQERVIGRYSKIPLAVYAHQNKAVPMGLLPDTQNSGCACAGNAGNIFPVTTGKRSRHASRHVLHARAVISN